MWSIGQGGSEQGKKGNGEAGSRLKGGESKGIFLDLYTTQQPTFPTNSIYNH